MSLVDRGEALPASSPGSAPEQRPLRGGQLAPLQGQQRRKMSGRKSVCHTPGLGMALESGTRVQSEFA